MSTTAANESGPIVVGVDGSESSLAALVWAATQAHYTGSPLHALMTWSFPANYAAYGLAPAIPEDIDFEGETVKVLHASVESALGAHHDLAVTEIVEEGHAAPALVEASASASLIVVGSRGHGGFTGLLIGSVSEHVAAHAHCPVVVIHHR